MIDKLIASDFAALAVENRQAIPALDSLRFAAAAATPAPKPLRAKRLAWLGPTLPIIIAVAGVGTLLELDSRTFGSAPQLAIALAVVVIVMARFISPVSVKASRPLADVLAAVAFTAIAVIGYTVEWRRHLSDCMYVDSNAIMLGPCQAARIVTTTRFAVISWGAVLLMTAVAARLIRSDRLRAWSIPSKMVVLTVLVTWLGLNEYMDRVLDVAYFQIGSWGGIGAQLIEPNMAHVEGRELGDVVRWASQRGQWNALEAGAVLFGLALSIGVASMRERTRPSRWLTILESPAIIPLGVIVTTVSLVLASAQWDLFELHRGDFDDVPWYAAWASLGAVVAYASMLLRRRRREALS